MPELRREIVRGLAWLPARPAAASSAEYATGSASGHWQLRIERWSWIGRLGWQRVTEVWQQPEAPPPLGPRRAQDERDRPHP